MTCVVTVTGSADECRPRNAQRVMRFKYAASPTELNALDPQQAERAQSRCPGIIQEWNAEFVEADPQQIGFPGSPTKVKSIENVVFTAKESRRLDNDDAQIEELIKELIANHTIG